MRRMLLVLLLPLLFAAAAWFLAGRWTPPRSAFPKQGIDVSHHQGAIDWAALPSQGVDFAYIKATEGGDHRDRLFPANWNGAAAASIPRGAYHFFTLCRPGAEQAANFIAVVPIDRDALPPAIDLEYLGNCGGRLSPDELRAELGIFIRIVEAHYGKPVLLYITEEFDRFYRISTRIPRRLWLRSILAKPSFGGRPWHLWQASNFRRLKGIEGRVDWNVAQHPNRGAPSFDGRT